MSALRPIIDDRRTSRPATLAAVAIVFAGGWSDGNAAPPTGKPAVTAAPRVELLPAPGKGLQPQVAVAPDGTVWLLTLTGSESASDIDVRKSTDGGVTWSAPIRVNSRPGSAIAAGTIRGPHFAVGKAGRLHVAWMGSAKAEPRAPGKASPMLYARSTADGAGFEPQRNLITDAVGLDGGGTVAADAAGRVWVAWHADGERGGGEGNRRVVVRRSVDDGETFEPEQTADSGRGTCGCCGMRGLVWGGRLWLLYRSAEGGLNRDMRMVSSPVADQFADTANPKARPARVPGTSRWTVHEVEGWRLAKCAMSTVALVTAADGAIAGWETEGRVRFGRLDARNGTVGLPVTPDGKSDERDPRKHVTFAVNGAGQVLAVWTQGASFQRGGTLGWQVFDAKGGALTTPATGPALPRFGLPAAFARPDGTFVIVH